MLYAFVILNGIVTLLALDRLGNRVYTLSNPVLTAALIAAVCPFLNFLLWGFLIFNDHRKMK